MQPFYRLSNTIRPYAWGSHDAIARFQNRPFPTDEPEAEVWMGAHPGAPSLVPDTGLSLAELIDLEPQDALGTPWGERGEGLPFLLKLLAAGSPLSLQAHPSAEQAREGFHREEAAQIPRDAPHRNYRDAHHKPELICALTEFHALCGFRRASEVRALIAGLDLPELAPLVAYLETHDACETFRWLLEGGLPVDRRQAVDAYLKARAAAFPMGPLHWAASLASAYPADPGVIGSLLLNWLCLSPGEAIYLPAGQLHAYLSGFGVEIMASSDNVLRGGLTPKHIDRQELFRVLDVTPFLPPVLLPKAPTDGVAWYETPTEEFRLGRVQASADGPTSIPMSGATILLGAEGELHLSRDAQRTVLRRGEAIFLPFAGGTATVEGTGVAFVATTALS